MKSFLAKTIVFVVLLGGFGFISAATTQVGLQNPLNASNVKEVLDLTINIATNVGVVIAVLALIYNGFKFIGAQGNPEEIKKSKEMFLYIIIGIALLLGARLILDLIKNTLESTGAINKGVFGN